MNIKGTRNDFLACLQKVSPAAQSGNINPILANVLLKADVNSIEIMATDQETQIKAPCAAKASKKFNVTVSAKKFQDILRLLKDGEVSFDYQKAKDENKSSFINISSGRTRYKLTTLDAGEFPQLGGKDKLVQLLKLPADLLLRSLKRVSYSSALNSHRLNLNGVLLEGSIDGLRLAATDGHRMAVQVINSTKISDGVQLILPRKSVNELIRNLPAEEDREIEIKASDRVVQFVAPGFELTSSIITESFPDYRSVIPHNNDKTVLVERQTFLTGLQRVSVLGDRGETVIIKFDKNTAQLECTNQENEEATHEISAEYQGEKIEMGFNVGFLVEMLSAVEEETFKISILESSSSVLIEPAASAAAAFQYVVMPIRL